METFPTKQGISVPGVVDTVYVCFNHSLQFIRVNPSTMQLFNLVSLNAGKCHWQETKRGKTGSQAEKKRKKMPRFACIHPLNFLGGFTDCCGERDSSYPNAGTLTDHN